MDGGDGVSDGGGPALVRGHEDESSAVVRDKRSCFEGGREIVLHLTRGADGYGFSLAAGNGVDAVKKGGAADEAQLKLGDRVVKVQGGKLLDGGGLALEEPQDAGTRLSLTVRRHKDERKRKWQQSLRSGTESVTNDYEWPVVRRPVKNTAGLDTDTSEAGGISREQRIAAALRDVRLRHMDRRISLAVAARTADRHPSSSIRKRQHQRGRARVDRVNRSSTGTGTRLGGERRRRRRLDTSEAPGGDR